MNRRTFIELLSTLPLLGFLRDRAPQKAGMKLLPPGIYNWQHGNPKPPQPCKAFCRGTGEQLTGKIFCIDTENGIVSEYLTENGLALIATNGDIASRTTKRPYPVDVYHVTEKSKSS